MEIDVTTVIENIKFTLTEEEARFLKLMCTAKTDLMAEAIRRNGYLMSDDTAHKVTAFMQDVFYALRDVKITNGDL